MQMVSLLFISEGAIIKNRQIVVQDTVLNALLCRVSPIGNRTLAQKDLNGETVKDEDCFWNAPYQVVGYNADITINLPDFNYEGNPAGAAFDRSQYPPREKMISAFSPPVLVPGSEEFVGKVSFSFGAVISVV